MPPFHRRLFTHSRGTIAGPPAAAAPGGSGGGGRRRAAKPQFYNAVDAGPRATSVGRCPLCSCHSVPSSLSLSLRRRSVLLQYLPQKFEGAAKGTPPRREDARLRRRIRLLHVRLGANGTNGWVDLDCSFLSSKTRRRRRRKTAPGEERVLPPHRTSSPWRARG